MKRKAGQRQRGGVERTDAINKRPIFGGEEIYYTVKSLPDRCIGRELNPIFREAILNRKGGKKGGRAPGKLFRSFLKRLFSSSRKREAVSSCNQGGGKKGGSYNGKEKSGWGKGRFHYGGYYHLQS